MSETTQQSTAEAGPVEAGGELDEQLANQLVERAKAQGTGLTGPDGLLSKLTKQVLEAGLEAELTEHVGYEPHAAAGRNGQNSRNGIRSKTVTTDVGPVGIDVPRDRDGSFEPKLVKKRQRRLSGVDEMVCSLVALVILSFRVIRGFDLRCPVVDGVVDGAFAA